MTNRSRLQQKRSPGTSLDERSTRRRNF